VCSVQGNLIGTLSGHGSWVLNVAFCPDNVHFVSWYVVCKQSSSALHSNLSCFISLRLGQRTDCFVKSNFLYDDTEKCSISQAIQIFTWSKTGVLSVISLKYSLHKFTKTILHRNLNVVI